MSNAARPFLFAIALAMVPAAAHADPPDSGDIAVAIRRDGDAIEVEVELLVKATPQEAWNVLTDYDHMAEFVSLTSRIVVAPGRNRGGADEPPRLRPVRIQFDNVREIELVRCGRSLDGRRRHKCVRVHHPVAAEGDATGSCRGRFLPVAGFPVDRCDRARSRRRSNSPGFAPRSRRGDAAKNAR